MKARSFCARVLFLFVSLLISTTQLYAQPPGLRDDLRRSFTKVDVVHLGRERLRSDGNRTRLSFTVSGRSVELVVEPHDMRAARYRAEDANMIGTVTVDRPPVTTFKGTVNGDPDSVVRLTIDGEKVEGFYQTGADRYFIEPAKKYSRLATAGDAVVYKAEDSLIDSTFFCGADLPGKIEYTQELARAANTESVTTLRVLELATEADLEFVNLLGGPAATNTEILGILNMVEGTYSTELNLSIRVVYQHTWSTADPFVGADTNGILTSFVNHWNANFGSVARDAAHLFTGKDVAQGRGIAYLGVVCRAPAYSYGLSGYVGWAPGKFLVPAHEIGHNLGADHVDATQNCANTLMNPTLTNLTPLSFCTFSRDAISTYVASNNSCLSEVSVPAGVTPFDFDGDGRSDISVFRPSNGVWYLNRSTNGFLAYQFGLNGDKPVASDYDGDGKADAAVYRGGVWYRLKSATNTTDVINFGLAADIASPADLDGDGKSDVVVYRPSNGVWYSLASSTGAFAAVRFGLDGDVPLPGDYDGDGRDDINVWRPATGTWYRLNSSNGAFFAMNFGLLGDRPVAADFDGDSKADIAVWRPSNGVWYVIRSSSGAFSAQAFGLNGDIPTTADYDGDGTTDISVFRPSNGVWYRLNSSTGAFAAMQFGLNGDVPLAATNF